MQSCSGMGAPQARWTTHPQAGHGHGRVNMSQAHWALQATNCAASPPAAQRQAAMGLCTAASPQKFQAAGACRLWRPSASLSPSTAGSQHGLHGAAQEQAMTGTGAATLAGLAWLARHGDSSASPCGCGWPGPAPALLKLSSCCIPGAPGAQQKARLHYFACLHGSASRQCPQ